MKDEGAKLTCSAKLVVDKMDPHPTEGLVDLYVSIADFRVLCELFGQNRITVALRMKGVG